MILFVITLQVFLPVSAFSQKADRPTISSPDPSSDHLPFKDRISLKTNALEWLCTIPNVGVEFDVSSSPFNTMSFGISLKYNWHTWHRYEPSVVFDLFEIRPEYRFYFRTRPKVGTDRPEKTFMGRSLYRENARFWRAYYIGPYASFASYSFKFTEKGIQGLSGGIGVSAGYVLPLYTYGRGDRPSSALDVEFGVSVGFQIADYDRFLHNPDSYQYTRIESESRCRMVPYPLVTELRVAFAWGRRSVSEKYNQDNPVLEEIRSLKKDVDDLLTYDHILSNFTESYDWDEEAVDRYAADRSLWKKDFMAYADGEAAALLRQVDSHPVLDEKARQRVRRYVGKSVRKIRKKMEDEHCKKMEDVR